MRWVSRFFALAVSVVVAACNSGSYDLELAFAEGVDPSAVRYIEVLVLPTCPDPSTVAIGDPPIDQSVARLGLTQGDATDLPSLAPLPPGSYGFYARGYDQTCHPIVSSCTTVRITDRESGQVHLDLAPTTSIGNGCGFGFICSDGRCEGVDASGIVDACVDNPCGADSYCTDLPDPAPGDATGRTCTPTTPCATGQFQMVAPTATSDRVCGTCAAACGAGSYESVACANGNGTSDRVCLPITDCTSGQYQLSGPTATSDRLCGVCTTCSSTQFETSPCANGNAAQNRTCQLLTVCTTGQFESIPPTANSDRVCGSCDVCTASEYETTACANGNGGQNRVCTPLTNCTVGQYQTVAPTATSDRQCGSCTVCAIDQYVVTECSNGNGTQDRVCGGGSATCTLTASMDGSTTGSNTGPTMSTTYDGASAFHAFVKFDLGGTCAEGQVIPSGATVTAVTITLTETNACVCSGTAHELRRVTGSWSEASTLTGMNPTVNGSASATFSTPGVGASVAITGGTLIADVQGFLANSSSNHGFRISQTDTLGNLGTPWRWATRENATTSWRPTIAITYDKP